jgi:hypothetical protein
MKNKKTRDPACMTHPLIPRSRSASHVGMILSFVIFITFIIFLYSVVKPAVSVGQDKKTIADYLVAMIVKNVSSDFNSTSVEMLTNPGRSCVKLDGFFVLLVDDGVLPQCLVQNKFHVLQTSVYFDNLGELIIDRADKTDTFFRIYTSQKYSSVGETTKTCTLVTQANYKIGVITNSKYPFGSNLNSLIENYKSNYEQVKTDLKVPPGTEFGFGFRQSDGTNIEVGEVPATANVYAEEIPIQYIDDKANILSGFINIKVW